MYEHLRGNTRGRTRLAAANTRQILGMKSGEAVYKLSYRANAADSNECTQSVAFPLCNSVTPVFEGLDFPRQ
jgi:hypothetical protein